MTSKKTIFLKILITKLIAGSLIINYQRRINRNIKESLSRITKSY